MQSSPPLPPPPHTASTSTTKPIVHTNIKSFAEVVGKARSPSIPLEPPATHLVEPALFFSEEDIDNLASPFQFALIGKFSHGRPVLAEIRAAFESFSLKSPYTIGLMDPRHILIHFNSEKDFLRVWLRE